MRISQILVKCQIRATLLLATMFELVKILPFYLVCILVMVLLLELIVLLDLM